MGYKTIFWLDLQLSTMIYITSMPRHASFAASSPDNRPLLAHYSWAYAVRAYAHSLGAWRIRIFPNRRDRHMQVGVDGNSCLPF